MKNWRKNSIILVIVIVSLLGASMVSAASWRNYKLRDSSNQNWMSVHKTLLQNMAIDQVTLLGTHDSLSYNVTDGYPCVEGYKRQPPPATDIDKAAAITQPCDVLTQLQYGVRFLDFRVASQNEVPYGPALAYWGCHDWLSIPLAVPVAQIKEFLQTNPNEIIILNIKNLYDENGTMNSKEQSSFYQYLQTSFGSLIVSAANYQGNFSVATLGMIWNSPGRIIILGDASKAGKTNNFVWDNSAAAKIDDQWFSHDSTPDELMQDLTTKVQGWSHNNPFGAKDYLRVMQGMTATQTKMSSAVQTNAAIVSNIMTWNSIYKINIIQVDDATDSGLMPFILQCNGIMSGKSR